MTSTFRATRSIATVVIASLISAVAGITQTFLIPRLLSVDDFGRWRTLLLYMGYAGLLHFGLVDGSLLSWTKNDWQPGQKYGSMSRSLKFLAIEYLLLLGAVLLLLFVPGLHKIASFLAVVIAYASIFNIIGVIQVYQQSIFNFNSVALAMSGSSVIFVTLLTSFAFIQVSIQRLVTLYLLSWSITLVVLLILVRRQTLHARIIATNDSATPGIWQTGWMYIAIGWPIVLANTGFGLMQSADRVTVNLVRPIHDFAIYSLSQSTIYVPITILAAVSRVALSYFARATAESRGGVYRASTQLITMLWIVLLPYYFVVEVVVRRYLPKYIGGLAPGRILLLSVLFLSLIQIVQLNTYSLAGRQRQFFIGSIVAVIVAFATAWIGSQIVGTLTAVAWSQVLTAALWWLGNEWFLRVRTGVRAKELLLVLTGFVVSAATLYGVQSLQISLLLTSLLYLGVGVPLCCILFWSEVNSFARVLAKART